MGVEERESVDGVRVPVPPFDSYAEAQRFHRLLLLFLRDLKEAGEPISRQQYLLAGVVDLHGPAAASTDRAPQAQAPAQQPCCALCGTPYPCRTVLAVAVGAGLPIAWSAPAEVVPVLRDAGLPPGPGGEVTAESVAWERGWGARREAGGGWEIGITIDRGEVATVNVPDDAAMARYLADRAGPASLFPYGWVEDPAQVAAVRPAAYAQAAQWREQAGLPYLTEHQAFGAPPA